MEKELTWLLIAIGLVALGLLVVRAHKPSEAEREMKAGEDRFKRLKLWAKEHYPDFNVDECPTPADHPEYELLHDDWINDLNDVVFDFNQWEEENGPYKER